MKQEINNLLYGVRQLISDVELSTSGQQGAHQKSIARVKSNMAEVEAVLNNVKADALEELCKANCYFCRMGDTPALNPRNGYYFHSDSFQEGPQTGSWPFICAAADIRKGAAAARGE